MIHAHSRFAAVRLAAVALIVASVVAAAGCRRSDRLPTYTVDAKVVFPDGKPLQGGQITFRSVEHELSATGAIQPDGTFELTTYEPGDGAVVGLHKVAITLPIPEYIDPDEARPPRLIDVRFEDLETSGLEFTVTEDGPNDSDILVERPSR